jgi:hypothetical protein
MSNGWWIPASAGMTTSPDTVLVNAGTPLKLLDFRLRGNDQKNLLPFDWTMNRPPDHSITQ